MLLGDKSKKNLFWSILVIVLPIFSSMSVLFLNIPFILLTDLIIAVLCVVCVVFRKLIPEFFFPLVLFSFSMTLIYQILLTSPHIVGWDANLEFLMFLEWPN